MKTSTDIRGATNGARSSEFRKGWITVLINVFLVLLASVARKYGFEVDTGDLGVVVGANTGVAGSYILGRTMVKRRLLNNRSVVHSAPRMPEVDREFLRNNRPDGNHFPPYHEEIEPTPMRPPYRREYDERDLDIDIRTQPQPPLS
ncbi:MAG: hypothetical protein AAF514_12950 [Verrucomicrobiota bacterium]